MSVLGLACGGSATNDSPTEAYKRLFAAVKAKNTEAIRNEMTKNTQEFAIAAGERQKNPIEKVFENGFTSTTFAQTLPEIRDERVAGNMGAIEVWNAKDRIWEDLPYMIEDGVWKLAVGELFGGSYTSPGKGRAAREKEAANSMPNIVPQPVLNSNTNSNAKPPANVKYDGPQVEPLKTPK